MSTTNLSLNLAVGKVYRFKFIAEFSTLGYVEGNIESGIFKLVEITTYAQLVKNEISLYKELFTKVSISEETFKTDYEENVISSPIYKLVNPMDETSILYMPVIYIAQHPDVNVKEYVKLLLSFDIGAVGSEDILSTDIGRAGLSQAVKDHIEDEYGIVDDPEVIIYRHVWMTETDYQAIADARALAKSVSTNIRSLNRKLQEENNNLKARIAALEETITNNL